MKSSTPEYLAEKNRKVIINTLKAFGPLSRAEISRRVGLSFPAVSSNVGFLIDEDYIREVGEGDNSMGRKSTLLKFNSDKGYVLGIDLGRYKVKLAIADLLGNMNCYLSKEIKNLGTNSPGLKDIIEESQKQSGIDAKQIKAVCVGTPGVVSDGNDKIILAPFSEGIDKNNILKEIKSYFKCPVTIANTVSLGAIGEKWKGCGSGYKNIVYINYGIGIGSAYILNDSLFTGTNGVAGEIGFMVTSPESVKKEYTEVGVLEQKISGHSLDRLVASQTEFNTLKDLFLSDSKEAKVLQSTVINDIEKYLGSALINISSVINPQVIIMSGGIGINIGKLLVSKWETMLEANNPFPPKILISEVDSYSNVLGAIRYALKNVEDMYCALD